MANVNKINSKPDFLDYYEILQCERSASTEELRRRYQNLALSTHPDKASHHNDRFLLIQEAWNTLRDTELRKVYNAQLASAEHSNSGFLLYDVINLTDMDLTDGVYTYLCRCGSNYVIEESEKNLNEKSVIINCEECSFSLKVNL